MRHFLHSDQKFRKRRILREFYHLLQDGRFYCRPAADAVSDVPSFQNTPSIEAMLPDRGKQSGRNIFQTKNQAREGLQRE